jgi:hypothetical protein
MSIKEIPASFEYSCDNCGKTHVAQSKGRPSRWSELLLKRDAYDFQGAAVADASVTRLLCDACTEKVVAALNALKASQS